VDVDRALEIVRCLADGVDPHTGEILPNDSPYQHPDAIRALYKAIEAMARARERADRSAARVASSPRAAGTPWSGDEDENLRREFAENKSVAQIAASHGRTQGAIASRLLRLELG
jgi:hypothetical protein